ncbi:oxidoreductase [Pseudonocardia ailaonensis]|uniref:Oxidoreductase n=1 Tax=Pseudonocardia ailaonensis TaxID=367279 RepID=A0ABN2MV35_9PSEU
MATARDAGAVRDLGGLALSLDVTVPEQVRAAVAAAESEFGGVDVLVNNAGYSYRAATEEGDDADVRRLFDTNYFGAVDLVRAVLPGMRARRSGAVVAISSIATRAGLPGGGYYAATKAAVDAMMSSLRAEVAPLGITAMTVVPGAFRTDFAGRSLVQAPREIADYAATAGLRRKENDTSHGTQPGDPARAAAAILATLGSAEPPAVLVLGADARGLAERDLDSRRELLRVAERYSTEF